MTQMPQSSQTSEMVGQDPQGEAPAPAFRPYLPSTEPQKRSRLPLVLVGLSVVLTVGGLAFWSSRPDAAESAVVDVGRMTPEQLAENASMAAAMELLRRLDQGPPAERAACSRAMNGPRSARLTRNLAMARALQQQKRANEMRLRAEREMRMAEEGY